LLGPVRPEVPASVLQLHANLTVISDIDLRGNGI
jgi:6-phosphogluconolactonase/glucosamine-6-phosphate isomerase/deaminase